MLIMSILSIVSIFPHMHVNKEETILETKEIFPHAINFSWTHAVF
jgi:hypothetical protein